MAVDSITVSKQVASGKKEKIKSPQKKEPKSQGNAIPASPAKRNKSPGIRVVGGRIYDPVNGKTCHQCRQKTRDFAAACSNQRDSKPCTLMLCHKCLLNRYGEKAEEVAALGEWICPKCRGICNCSVCMKKKGHQPTGILINTAKATGFSSVSEMLLKGVGNFNREKVVADKVTTPKKESICSPRKRGKENSFDGKVDANLPDPVEKKSKKVKEEGREKRKAKQERLEGICDHEKNTGGNEESGLHPLAKKPKTMKKCESREVDNGNCGEMLTDTSVHDDKKKSKSSKREGLAEKDDTKGNDATLARRTSPRKLKSPAKTTEQEPKLNVGVNSKDKVNTNRSITHVNPLQPLENDEGKDVNVTKHRNPDLHTDIPLPLGTELTNVAGIDVRAEDAGNALQFLEFCAVFGQALGVKKGQPENVLRDLLHGRTGRRGKFSATVQFQINLLPIILRDQGNESGTLAPSHGKNFWFNALKKCLSGYQTILKAEGLDLERTADYESVDTSMKLRLLNILCDELLTTTELRTWMENETANFAETIREAKQKVHAAKDKEKSLKQKLKDDIAKAVIAKQGASLSIAEHEALVSHIKSEAAKAHAEVLESEGLFMKNNQSCDAVRVEPVFTGHGGHAYWKLNYSGKSDLLRQNVGKGDALTLDEKWFTIDVEGKEAIEKHISSLRRKRLRAPKVADVQS